eukprot:scaffold67505_cov19-Prasinocladus_malaysianus.AAC.1
MAAFVLDAVHIWHFWELYLASLLPEMWRSVSVDLFYTAAIYTPLSLAASNIIGYKAVQCMLSYNAMTRQP